MPIMSFIPQDKILHEYIENLPAVLDPFSNFLGDNSWFASQKITFVDFPMNSLSRIMIPGCFKNYSNLKQFFDRLEELHEEL